MIGFEPMVFCSQSRRDNQASLHPDVNGAVGRIRTRDPLIRSQILYPAELLPRMEHPSRFELLVSELQSLALPLGYGCTRRIITPTYCLGNEMIKKTPLTESYLKYKLYLSVDFMKFQFGCAEDAIFEYDMGLNLDKRPDVVSEFLAESGVID